LKKRQGGAAGKPSKSEALISAKIEKQER